MGKPRRTMHSKVTLEIPLTEHKKWKTAALMMDMSMKDFVLIGMRSFMQMKPNKVTEKALKQSKAGKNVKKFDTIYDLFEDLGI